MSGWLNQFFAICLLVLLWGCASAPSGPVEPGVDLSRKSAIRNLDQRLRAEVRHWRGTPHRWGGTTKRGIDCSGLVQRVYADLFRHRVPRSTELQSRYGQYIRKSRLQSGDLVFFKLTRSTRHVGIYLSRGEFVHASSSKGVTVSKLSNPYWQKHYWMSRRYLKH